MNEQAKDSLNVFQRKVRFYPPVLHILIIPTQNIGTISNSVIPIRGK